MKPQKGSPRPGLTSGVMGDAFYRGGTLWGFSLGMWNVPAADLYVPGKPTEKVTGMYILPGSCGYTSCHDMDQWNLPSPEFGSATAADGKKYPVKLTSGTPIGCSPQVAGAGLTLQWGLASPMPYTASLNGKKHPEADLATISIPVTIMYLRGLTNVGGPGSTPTPVPPGCEMARCCYSLNLKFPTGDIPYTKWATEWSWTSYPLYP